jgi:RNA polymerase sigma-70 factor, ECF subfamily
MLYSFETTSLEDRTVCASDLSNEQLLERIKQRDELALQELFARHRGLLQTVVGRIVPNDTDRDEVIQDCMLEVWNHAESYDSTKGQALGWLVTLLRRRGIDRVRRIGAYWRAQERLRLETEGDAGAAVQCGADEEASQVDRADAIARLIANLPPTQQEVVRLTYFQGLSQRNIAKRTAIPLGTIKTRLELGIRKLRSAVLAFGELHEPAHARV